jgi:ABC-type multidrug transport system fused ATPase/permease subunit
MVVLMALAQVVGVGSIAPFVSVLVNPDSAQTNAALHWAFEGLGFSSTGSFLFFLALGVLVAVLAANAFLALNQWMLIRIGWSLQNRLSRRLLEAYLSQPYSAFLRRNSADTGKNILAEVELLTNGVILPILHMVAYAAAGLFLAAALFWINTPLTLAVIALFGLGYGGFYLAARHSLKMAGQRRINANSGRYKVVSEAFGGIKETKVLGREAALLGQYDGPAREYTRAQTTAAIARQLPTYALQVLAVGVVLMLALFTLGRAGGAIADAAPVMAIYIFAAQRLVPFLLLVYQNGNEIRFNSVALDAVYDDLMEEPKSCALMAGAKTKGERLPFLNELRLERVTFKYPGADKPSVEDITLSIPRHGFVAIVGATGAGKTTLVDIILGLLKPDEGVLTVDGRAIDDTSMRSWQNNLGYVPQDIYLADDSIAANIAFGIPPEERRSGAIERAARVANIHDFIADELAEGYETVVGERGVRLSGGQRQRIGIARALYHDPEVLILDEATSNLDQGTEAAVHTAIEQAAGNKTVILIAHRLFTTRQCDTLFVLEHGRLVAEGSYQTLLRTSDRFMALAGTG